MTGIFAEAFGIIAETFGRAATYLPPGGGSPIACTILRDMRDDSAEPDDGRPLTGRMTIEVRASEIAQPQAGGVFTVDGRGLRIANRPMLADPDGLIWRMWVE